MAALPGPEPPQWVVHEADSGARPLSRRNSAAFYWFDYLPESNTVYVKYNACREMQDVPFKEFTRRVFEQIDRTEARLVVDVRDNGGGNSAIFGPFLEALQQRRAIGQQGRLLVIVGRRTFSSAILNAMALKQDHKGILVGEPTGGRPNHYGEVRSLALPGTGLNLTYSTKYFKTSAVDPASLEPDLRADNTSADYVAGPSEQSLLIDFAAYRRMVAEYVGKDTEDARILLEWVKGQINANLGAIYRIIPDSYGRGRVAAQDHTQMAYAVQGELSAILTLLVAQVLDTVYVCREMEFDAPAPFNEVNAINVINDIVKTGMIPRGA